jgi:hypothetical protein
MKVDKVLIAVVFGFALAFVGVGFLLGRASSKPASVQGIYPDTTLIRRITDANGFLIRILNEAPGWFRPDTVWRDSISYVVIDSTTPIGSIPRRAFERKDSIVGPQHKVVFKLINYCRGIYEGYDLIPLYYQIEQQGPRTSYFLGSIGVGYSHDQNLAAQVELGYRYKRVSASIQGLHLNGDWIGVGWIKAHF